MKKTILIGLILLEQLSCSNENISSFHDDSSILTLNGTWKVVSFEDYKANTTEFKNQENSWGRDITITFDDTKDPKEITGQNTTNEIIGQFDYEEIRKFKITQLYSTQVGQPNWADKFTFAILDNENNFKINILRLRIYYDNNRKSVTLERQK